MNRPLIGICAAAAGISRRILPVRNPATTMTLIDQACSPIRPPSQSATAMPITTATTRWTASRTEARTVSRATRDAVIGAQIGDGDPSSLWASAQLTPADTAIFNACINTAASRPSRLSNPRRRQAPSGASSRSRAVTFALARKLAAVRLAMVHGLSIPALSPTRRGRVTP
jgi:hypothetical protein